MFVGLFLLDHDRMPVRLDACTLSLANVGSFGAARLLQVRGQTTGGRHLQPAS